ncbi:MULTISPECIES: hypothetical protein [unclassified Ekhidna]|jgi:hypothetical protein|uniref:hypothetical protein n=1 Tax=unclassified Ekhidna TaxID=2632188 RepID=UPI0032DEF051
MEAIYFNQLMDLSVEYEVNGVMLKRNVVAGKKDEYGTMWVLVETSGDSHSANKQWVELSFFQMWLNQMGAAA